VNVEDRFWAKVDKSAPNGCWEWTASINDHGYGQFGIAHGNNPERAHRFAWRQMRGEIPKDRWVLHKCDNRKCCNPDHLFLGTAKDNTQDCIKKGRFVPSLKPGQDHRLRKWDAEHVLSIRWFAKMKYPRWEIGRKVGVPLETVQDIASRQTWKEIGI